MKIRIHVIILFFVFTIIYSLNIFAEWKKIQGPLNGMIKINGVVGFYAGTDSGVYSFNDTENTWILLQGSPKNITSLFNNMTAGTRDSGIYENIPKVGWLKWCCVSLSTINDVLYLMNNYLIATNNGLYIADLQKQNSNAYLINSSIGKVNAIAATPYDYRLSNPIGIYSTYYYIYAGTDSGIFFNRNMTDINGSNTFLQQWERINNGLKSLKITALTSPTGVYFQDTNFIFAGTEVGIYYSLNRGQNWYQYTDGKVFFDSYVTAIHYSYPYLYAATYNNGIAYIWRLPISDILPTNINKFNKFLFNKQSIEFNVSNNILKYKLSKTSDVEIRIYDLKGKVVYNTRFYNQMQGEYLFSLMQRGINAGVYILELKAVGNKIQKPINIIRR